MSLKGEDGLVKMYAMVNVQQYNIVETTASTVAECEATTAGHWPTAASSPTGMRRLFPLTRRRSAAPSLRSAPLCWTAIPTTSCGWRTGHLLRRQRRGEPPGGDPECRGSGDYRLHRRGRAAAFSPAPPSPGRRDPVTFTPEEAPADAPRRNGPAGRRCRLFQSAHLKMQSPSRPCRRLRRALLSVPPFLWKLPLTSLFIRIY